jgi:hypothetical protein
MPAVDIKRTREKKLKTERIRTGILENGALHDLLKSE